MNQNGFKTNQGCRQAVQMCRGAFIIKDLTLIQHHSTTNMNDYNFMRLNIVIDNYNIMG